MQYTSPLSPSQLLCFWETNLCFATAEMFQALLWLPHPAPQWKKRCRPQVILPLTEHSPWCLRPYARPFLPGFFLPPEAAPYPRLPQVGSGWVGWFGQTLTAHWWQGLRAGKQDHCTFHYLILKLSKDSKQYCFSSFSSKDPSELRREHRELRGRWSTALCGPPWTQNFSCFLSGNLVFTS